MGRGAEDWHSSTSGARAKQPRCVRIPVLLAMRCPRKFNREEEVLNAPARSPGTAR